MRPKYPLRASTTGNEDVIPPNQIRQDNIRHTTTTIGHTTTPRWPEAGRQLAE
jgi:hypothetical protein